MKSVARGLCPLRLVLHAFKAIAEMAGLKSKGRGYSSDNV